MTIEIKPASKKGKYFLLDTFEIGNSGEYDVRVLTSNLSLKKANELKEKYDNGGELNE